MAAINTSSSSTTPTSNNPPETSTSPSGTFSQSTSDSLSCASPMVFLTLPVHTKLSRTNFLAWKSQIEPLLHAYGLSSFLTSPPVSSSSPNPVTGQLELNPNYLPWYKQDQMILAWLRASLSESILAQVVSCSTSGELWRHLVQTFSASSRARFTELRKKLQNTTKGSGSCSDFIQQIRSLSDELAFIGAPVSDQDLVLAVLGGLNPDYNSFVIAVNSRQDPMSFLEVQSLLLSHESLLQTQQAPAASLPSPANPTAFYAANFSYRPPNNQNRNSRSSKPRGAFSRPPHNAFRPRVPNSAPLLPTPSGFPGTRPDTGTNSSETCQICYKRGHLARACWWRCDMRYTDDVPPSSAPPPPSVNPQAHVAHTAAVSNSNATEWYIDSGATHHVTSDLNNLSSFVPYEGLDRLQIGDGKGMNILHIGNVCLSLGNTSVILHEVLHVPTFTKNLLSLSRLLSDNNLRVEFHSCFCIVKDCLTSTTLLQATVTNGLYMLTAPTACVPVPHALLGERVNALTWHYRLGHPAMHTTSKLLSLFDLPCTSTKLDVCEHCAVAKCHKLPFSSSTTVTTAPLELIHADVWGPAPVVTANGFKYFVLFVDDFSKFSWIFFLSSKAEVVTVFSSFKLQVENLFSTNIKILHTDGGTEFSPLTRLYPQVVHQLTCPHTPEQNGVVERKNRHILELALAVIDHACIPLELWDEIFASIVFLINRLPPSHSSTATSPFEILFHTPPNYLELRVLGSRCFPLTRPYNKHKLQPHSVPCVFLGYALSQKGYRCYHPATRRMYVSRHVIFHEQVLPFKHTGSVSTTTSSPASDYSLWALPLISSGPPHPPSDFANGPRLPDGPLPCNPEPVINNNITSLSPARSLQRSTNSNPSDRSPARPSDHEITSSTPSTSLTPDQTPSAHHMITRNRDNTRRSRQFPDFVAYLASAPSHSDPTSFAIANKQPHWRLAMSQEIQALHNNHTWDLVAPPDTRHIVGCKWVFKTKRRSDGTIERHKARLVAKGFTQEEGIDYFDTFSPVIRPTTIRIVLSLALSNNWAIRQLDVNNAFLHGQLQETVYMHQPPGFVNPAFPSHVCLLKKAIYGLKQSPRAWFHTLSSALIALGFHGSKFDPSLFISHQHGQTIIILIYVDDIIVTGSHMDSVTTLIHTLQSKFSIKDLGPLSFFLGIAVQQTPGGLHLSQQQYISDLLCRTHMAQAQPVSTPMAVNTSLSKFVGDPFHDPKLYRAVVGALQYVTITRPEISFPVNKCSQFMHSPTTEHWIAVKRILRYLKGTITHGLYFQASSPLTLHAYSDSDWAGCPDDRRSTSAFCIYLGPNLISWSSKKQPTVSKSSTEAEYRSLALAGAELIWVQHILHELHQTPSQTPILWCDNVGAAYLASNPMYHARTKHVEIDFHFIRERVVARQLLVQFISSRDQIADGLTKGLTTDRFISIRDKLMVCLPPSTCGGGVRNKQDASSHSVMESAG
ncbi:hypothetical protein LUZ62_089436 [Rhynchospora pubera]|uniref:Integrase catalytic domain-containing protein n=1 Tax=Rhynchospora pubera TaxID=906938 RepID=A0AAV8CI00_9POAL|nr:hypothetical protein LUZ62_089436 [Rhynchospora pubera]